MNSKTVTILLIDDDEADREAIQRSFKKEKIANPLIVAEDGVEGLKVLRSAEVESPFLILLDLNMPRMSGKEFLEELRRDPKLKNSIVFVLTTSDEDKDKVAAYEKNVAGYVVKPNAGQDFVDLLSMLKPYWRIVEFPPTK